MVKVKTGSSIPRRSALQVQWSVIYALFRRDLSSRYGHLKGGAFWAFMEPMLQVVLITGIFYMRGRKELSNIPIPMLVLSGIAPFILFRQLVSSSTKAFNSARALMNYRVIKPLDPILANTLHYSVFFFITMMFFLLLCAFFEIHIEQLLYLELVVNIGLLVMLGTGLGLLFCVARVKCPEVGKFIPFIIRPLFFFSGIFFTADSLPADIRKIFLINPLLHITEITRLCFYYDYPSHGDLSYVAVWALVSLFLGLAVFKVYRSSLLND